MMKDTIKKVKVNKQGKVIALTGAGKAKDFSTPKAKIEDICTELGVYHTR